MADKPENILVEFDYNNIVIIDPNKVIDENGKAKERVVKQEDLVMYANLECKVSPRTKLVVGSANNDAIQTVSIATINFLKPGGKEFMENSWTDEITGKGSTKGEGVNQPKLNSISNPNKSDDTYIRQNLFSNGKVGATDNGLLGITSINIRQNTSFMPVITIKLVDVKGRALFEGGDNSPYAAFFNLPYPMFHLTIKGFYGKAVRLPLMLQNFNTSFNYSSGNFDVTLTFYTYKYTLLSELTMGSVLAVPHMYKNNLTIEKKQGTPNQYVGVKDTVVEKGYQKVKEVYSEYKSKGLIPDEFPELTIVQMQNNIENFIKNILDSFTKENTVPLTNITEYREQLVDYQKNVFTAINGSWYSKNMDSKNFFIMNDNKKTRIFTYKKEVKDKTTAKNELNSIITDYNDKLNKNETVGRKGSFIVKNKEYSTPIECNVKIEDFQVEIDDFEKQIDIKETYKQRKNAKTEPTDEELNVFKQEVYKYKFFEAGELQNKDGMIEKVFEWYKFEDGIGGNKIGDKAKDLATSIFRKNDSFMEKTNQISKKLKEYREKIETALTEALSELLQDKDNGLGFTPNLRNVLSVIFANAEGFIRLLDDTHKTAWDINDNQTALAYRKQAIFNTQVAGASQDNLNSGIDSLTPIYPWPQLIVETSGENGQEKYEIRYPGDIALQSQTKSYLADVWPEVEFVEEFIKGLTQRDNPPSNPVPLSNEILDVKRISLDSIEFPIGNDVYANKEEIKFFFEIYERLLLVSNNSKLSRVMNSQKEIDNIVNLISEAEATNLTNSLSSADPYILKKLTDFNLNSSNFLLTLKHFSNQGLGQSWQNYIRGEYNTPYIKNKVSNGGFDILNQDVLSIPNSQPDVSLINQDVLIKYVAESTTSNDFDLTDIYPFADKRWYKNNLADSSSVSSNKQSFNTTKILNFDLDKKVITNYTEGGGLYDKKPITNFNFVNISYPNVADVPINQELIKIFYKTRTVKTQLPTEGNIRYNNYNYQLDYSQTTSIFNTPFFINSIIEGVDNFRNYSETPFISSAYYFINSLPLPTLREKYKKFENGATTDLDYIFATIKKFGAIHKVPYSFLLKIGSIWHRYKTYVETKVDILDNSWSGFNYTNNYDPDTNDKERVYSLVINGSQIDIVLQKDTTVGPELSTLINTGFYPKLIDTFNVFYQGYVIYGDYNGSTIQSGFQSGVTLNYVDSSIIDLREGFDLNNPLRDLRIIPWSVTVDTSDGAFSYVMPSQGSLFNQTLSECFDTNTAPINILKNEVKDNIGMYNGSVRLFWAAPNYGFFDNRLVDKPNPTQYIKKVIVDDYEQENFSFEKLISYTDISEIFSVFEKGVLDEFETMFLNFSKSIYDSNIDDFSTDEGVKNIINKSQDNVPERSLRNFQSLMRDMMKVSKEKFNDGEDFVTKVQQSQLKKVTNTIRGFLNYDVVFKYGNPSSFDRRLFQTFSQLNVVDPYTWEPYTVLTPNALPQKGGSVTVAQSELAYPNEWSTLKVYVGFSNISELQYKDSGSYITDFFIDFNIAFNVENIKRFTPIIKIYATQKLINGESGTNLTPSTPPTQNNTQSGSTNPNVNSYAILQDGKKVEVVISGHRKKGIIFNTDGSKDSETPWSIQPDDNIIIEEAILARYQSSLTINPITFKYIRPKSIITPPQTTVLPNVTFPSSLILDINKFNTDLFKELMTNYLVSNLNFQNKIIDNLMIKLQSALPKTTITSSSSIRSVVSGGEQSKSEIYETFKSLNDKWISGNDFKTKTLFEDVLLLDRASRNIGDKILVDIFKLKNRLTKINAATDVLTFVQTILVENHFVVMNLPSYVNFYNVQDAVKNPIPKAEGTMEFANTLFGTFLNVDYRNSSSKMVCFYGGKPSEIVDMKDNVDFRYRNDSFDLRRASDNPLVENQIDKNDWDKSNKVVGFNVDIGPQNQQIFLGFDVNQTAGKATAESIEVLNQMANQNGNRGGSTQSTSLYNLYKNRSYTCQVTMLGNALIQPTMYFNLRHVPMFSGPYMILEVNHTISPGSFITNFNGVRQPTASLPKINDYIQSLKVNLLKSVIDKIEENKKTKDSGQKNTTNVIDQKTESINNSTDKPANSASLSQSPSCVPANQYGGYTFSSPDRTTAKIKEVVDSITVQTNDIKLQNTIFAMMYLSSGVKDGFETNGHNYAGISIKDGWGAISTYFYSKLYYCSSGNVPYAIFENLTNSVKFLIERWGQRMGDVTDISKESITKFLIINSGPNRNEDLYNKYSADELVNYQNKVDEAINIFATQTRKLKR